MKSLDNIRGAARRSTLLGLMIVTSLFTTVAAQEADQSSLDSVQSAVSLEPLAGGRDCGTVVRPEDEDIVLYLESIGAYEVADGPRYVLYVPMTVHIVRQSNGAGGISQADVDSTMTTSNAHWFGLGMQFFQSGATRFLDNDNFYLNIDTQAEIDQLKATDSIGNTVNAYFTLNLAVEDGPDPGTMPDGLCGQSSFSWDPWQGVVMANGCTAQGGNTSTFAHEVGHYFDLLHTHETAFGEECPDGSNCGGNGDWVCDTPADPNLDPAGMMGPGCTYTGTTQRCGQGFNPDTRNLMSYAVPRSCRDRFSWGQGNRALACLVNQRSNLIGGQLAVTWVDFGHLGGENGSFNQPFNDLPSALAATGPGGRIVMRASSTPQTITINQSVTLDSFRGIATVGQ